MTLTLAPGMNVTPSLAAIPPGPCQEWAVGAAILLTLSGVFLCWRAPRHRMSLEERAKDGKLTPEQAHRRIRRQTWIGPAVIITGFVILGVIVMR